MPSRAPEINARRWNTSRGTSRLPVTFSAAAVTRIKKLGPDAIADNIKRKNVEGQRKNPCRKANGRPRSTPRHRRYLLEPGPDSGIRERRRTHHAEGLQREHYDKRSQFFHTGARHSGHAER